MSKFPSTSLAELKAPGRYSMVGGPFGSKLVSRDYVESGVPVIRGGNLPFDSRFSFEDMVYVTDEKVEADLAGNLAFPGDIVVTQRGTLGQVGLIPQDSPHPKFVVSQSQMKLTVDRSKADPLFVYYVLKSPVGQHEIHSRAITAGVPHINLSLFQKLQLPMPPLPIQHKIASVLSAHDDLIENNNRRIKLLEEMAQRIFREWFVDFRYPGHEAVPLVNSDLGQIPVGWNTGVLRDLVDVNGDTIRGSGTDELIDYIDISSVERGNVNATRRMMLSEAPGRARRRVSDGDILWSTVRPNLRAYALVLRPAGNCVASTGFAVLSPRHASFAYVYALTTTDVFVEYLSGRATGSAYPAVTSSTFEDAPVLIAPKDILNAFAEIVEPQLRLASLLARNSEVLRSTRDLLLPRLISGVIDVTDLDITVPKAA